MHELYHIRTGGIAAGAGRTLAFVGFPLGLAALAALPIVIDPTRRRHVLLAGLAATVLAIAILWPAGFFLAGLSFDRVPGLNSIYLTDQLASQPSRPGLHSTVHDGHHHGMDGVLLTWTALLLTRALPRLRHRVNRLALAVSSGFLLVYGLANAVQDAWTEQIVKREWTTYELPNVLVPTPEIGWVVIVLCTAAAAFVFVRSSQPGGWPGREA